MRRNWLDGRQDYPNRRQLETLGRFGDPLQLVIELTPGGYSNLGARGDVDANFAARVLLNVLPETQDDAQTAQQLTEKINSSEDREPKVKDAAIRMALTRLHKDREIERDGKGKKGDPHRYWNPGNV